MIGSIRWLLRVLICIDVHIIKLIGTIDVAESYLVALCKGDRQEEVLMLLERIDIKKLSSKEDMETILKSLGRFLLESHAKKFILELKGNFVYESLIPH